MTSRNVNRRRFVAGTAAASAAMVAAPFVRGAHAAGQVSVFFWDHWVPAGNVEMKKQVAAWSEKNKVEVKADFITSQGQQTLADHQRRGAGTPGARYHHDRQLERPGPRRQARECR